MATRATMATNDGLITLPSEHDWAETRARLDARLARIGIRVTARIDHGANARAAGMALRPTQLWLFGDARIGARLMEERQTVGIDLPAKMLVWEDEDRRVWVTYVDPAYVRERHGVEGQERVFRASSDALDSLARTVAGGGVDRATASALRNEGGAAYI